MKRLLSDDQRHCPNRVTPDVEVTYVAKCLAYIYALSRDVHRDNQITQDELDNMCGEARVVASMSPETFSNAMFTDFIDKAEVMLGRKKWLYCGNEVTDRVFTENKPSVPSVKFVLPEGETINESRRIYEKRQTKIDLDNKTYGASPP